MKTAKQLERYFKGVANHTRIRILLLVERNEGINLEDMAELLNINIKTISGHTKTLVNSGLLNKKYVGREISHNLSPYGRKMVGIIKKFQ